MLMACLALRSNGKSMGGWFEGCQWCEATDKDDINDQSQSVYYVQRAEH